MQHILAQIRKETVYFVTNIFSFTLRALGVESPRGEAIKAGMGINKDQKNECLKNLKIEFEVLSQLEARNVSVAVPGVLF